MNAGSVAVLGLVLALAALAVRRAWKKGAPCECGGSHKACKGGGCCCCGEKEEGRRKKEEGRRKK